MPTLPPDLQRLLDEIDAADRAGDEIAASVTDAQFQWQPPGGGWSIAECLEHLAKMNVFYSAPIRKAVDAARKGNVTRSGPMASSFFGRRFIQSLEPPPKMKTRSPAPARPGPPKPRAEVLRAYHEAHDIVRGVILDAAAIDLNRTTFPNPFFRFVRMRAGTALAIIAVHDRRHLWQAEHVRKGPGFPPA